MNVKKLAVLFAALMLPVSAWAIPFSASYTIDGYNPDGDDHGLVIQTEDTANNPFSFDLIEGDFEVFNLFKIWTDENNVQGDDQNPMPITVNFSFSQPGNISGSIDGETAGVNFFFVVQKAKVHWDDPLELTYGSLNDGLFSVQLFGNTFNEDWFGLAEGYDDAAYVKAKVTLIRAASVPEPGTLALLGLGLVALGASRRRS